MSVRLMEFSAFIKFADENVCANDARDTGMGDGGSSV